MSADVAQHGETDEVDNICRLHGIRRVPAETFEYGGYRYTNVKDAVAEAKRHPGLPSR